MRAAPATVAPAPLADPDPIAARLDAVEAALDTQGDALARIEAALGALATRTDLSVSPAVDPRHVAVLTALRDSLDGLDLPFTASEVAGHAEVHHGLAEALRICAATSSEAIGLLFRTLRGVDHGGLTLVRDGRCWRLTRTSCT